MEEQILVELGLEPERIKRDLDHCHSLGDVYQEKAFAQEESEYNWEVMIIASATSYRRAAAHSLLLGDMENSKACFWKSGQAYMRNNIPYGFMMFFLNLLNNRFTEISKNKLEEANDILIGISMSMLGRPNLFDYHEEKFNWIYVLYAFLLLDMTLYKNDYDWQLEALINLSLRERLDVYRNQSIGILGIPISSYLDLHDAIRQSSDSEANNDYSNNQISVQEALLPFLNSYDLAIRLARKNSYHWKRLAMPFHPAEPDIFGILLIVDKIMSRRNFSILNTIESIPLQQQSKIFLNEILSSLL